MSALKIGVYGKLPSHPDFVSESIRSEISNELYDWAQKMIYHGRDQMTEAGWLSAYLVSPIWRMCVPPSAERDGSWIGIMMPSVDAVGRYFPLFMTFEIDPKHINVEWLFKEADSLFLILEGVGLRALQERLQLGEVIFSLSQQIQRLSLGETVNAPTPLFDKSLPFSIEQPTEEQLQELLQTSISQLEGSIWWNMGQVNGIEKPFIHCSGLPCMEEYSFLLTGQIADLSAPSEAMESQG